MEKRKWKADDSIDINAVIIYSHNLSNMNALDNITLVNSISILTINLYLKLETFISHLVDCFKYFINGGCH